MKIFGYTVTVIKDNPHQSEYQTLYDIVDTIERNFGKRIQNLEKQVDFSFIPEKKV